MLGIGLVGLGVMVFVFLVKFIFSVARYDRSGIVEIKEADHPRLFAFLKQLSKETQTRFPKRVFLSPEVNACVFYDSSFLSMFLPVKKNLQIGLGLVNAVNLSEFKAIIAHEFGHFSQRSMKLGSFVYNVNRVIYNMLYENTSYTRSLQSWANVSNYFALFAGLTIHIVRGIQWILQKMYGLINRNYMGLSREMEFHADAVAASVSGSANCISALRRVELAASSYSSVIKKCNELYKEKRITANIYPNQQTVSRQMAEDYKLVLQNNLPVISDAFLQKLQVSRINYKDQWASHPALEEREANLTRLGVVADRCEDSAWILFDRSEQWQEQLTGKVYDGVELPPDIQTLDATSFEKQFLAEIESYSLPEIYNYFYAKRQITVLNIEELSAQPELVNDWKLIFSTENAGLHAKIRATETDIQILKAIEEKQINIKTFDFDGEKHDRDEAAAVSAQLQQELDALKQQLELADKQAYSFVYSRALQTGAAKALELKNGYIDHFDQRKQADKYFNHTQAMLQGLEPIYKGGITLEQVNEIISKLKNEEVVLKVYLRNWQQAGAFEASSVLKEKVQQFCNSQYAYFSEKEFFNNELNELQRVVIESWTAINDLIFQKFKSLLQVQQAYLD
jgi:Zn-dependent protease with chaperone function